MAYACGHPQKSHYSSGMCQNCYLAKYYIKRKNKVAEKAEAKAKATGGSTADLVTLKTTRPFQRHLTKVKRTLAKSN